MAILDTELEHLLVQRAFYEKNPGAGVFPLNPGDPLFVSVQFTGEVQALVAAGLKLASVVGPVAYGDTTLDGVVALSRLPQVKSIERLKQRRISLDGSVPDIKANLVWSRSGDTFTGYNGRGVLVGVIDTGIDFRHHTFRKGNASRVFKVWDQAMTGVAGETVPGPIPSGSDVPTALGYGVEYSKQQLSDSLAGVSGALAIRHVDGDGHGTHVAGIAAGDGSQSGHCHGAYRYIGVATDAELIVVRMFGLSGGDRNLPRPTTSNSYMMDAIRYILEEARKAGRPCAINLSLGFFSERVDGTASDCVAVDTLLNNNSTGRAIVFAAGNCGASSFHANASVTGGAPGAALAVRFRVYDGDTKERRIVVRYSGSNLAAQLTSPVAGNPGQVTWVANGANGASNTANGADPGALVTLINNTNRISFTIKPGTQPAAPAAPNKTNAQGIWTLELRDTASIAAGTTIDAYVRGGSTHDARSPRFLDRASTNSTIDEDASGIQCIAVGNYHVDGPLSASSGRGPVFDSAARTKPEICAPGEDICSAGLPKDRTGCQSCCCKCCQDFYIDLSGTSMAAPHVTGVIALMLHKNPNLTHTQIKQLLMANFAAPSSAPPANDVPGWGVGRVDANKTVSTGVTQVNPPVTFSVPDVQPLARVHERLLQTPRGPTLSGLFDRYGGEVWDLIQKNKRVATIWHRCRGPVWVRLALGAAQAPDRPLPLSAEGQRFTESVLTFAQALKSFGSEALRREVERWEQELANVQEGMSLYEVIETVGSERPGPFVRSIAVA